MDAAVTVKYFYDWLGKAFYDLCFASYIENEFHKTGFFLEFKCFYCLQAIEKILKCFLIYKNIIKNEKEAKKYSHIVSKLIGEVINVANNPILINSICAISSEYYNQLHGYKGQFLLPETKVSTECEKNIQQWCDNKLIKKVKWYFYLLEQSYFEVRYPFEIPLPSNYSTESLLYDRDIEYLNSGILVTTIKLFKLFLSLFEKKQL